MQKEVTCILTSCGRQDLLEITLSSFFKYNTYPIKEFYIYEDSGIKGVNDKLKAKYPEIIFIEPAERTGQIVALDRLWQSVNTEYAFTMEDDWETLRGGFIEESMEILEEDSSFLQVWLRDRNEANGHPILWQPHGRYGIMKTNHGLWTGCCWNPSLKRKSDYDRIKSFGKYTQFSRKQPWKAESVIGQLYQRLGYKAAILNKAAIRHIGENRHVD